MKQRRLYIWVLVLTMLLAGAAYVQDNRRQELVKTGEIVRGGPGEGNKDILLKLKVPELEACENYEVKVEERIYTKEEREALFLRAVEEIKEGFAAEGETNQHITRSVRLFESLQEGLVGVEWDFGDSEVIRRDGSIDAEYVNENGTLITVSAELTYREDTYIYSFPICVYPQELDKMAQIRQELASYFELQENSQEEKLELPKEVLGYSLHWEQKKEYTWLFILVLGVASLFLVRVRTYEMEIKLRQKRQEQLQLEYPVIVSEFALLLSAGMTTKTVLERLTNYYLMQLKHRRCGKKLIYEELLVAVRQLEDGVSEVTAYEQLAKRCELAAYRRFSMLLIQHVTKGNDGLAEQLLTEADRAFEERKNTAKKRGEEAGTKLLLPMFLMLGVVIVILLVPACMSMRL